MPDGLIIFRFSNGQVEKHFEDGTKEISYMNDDSVHVIDKNGKESIKYSDGSTKIIGDEDGL
eukprot:CAMPEP_0205805348 /NCGR_PEP_ID=MMETSP0205-20121125/8531_1 /ASSEMBLY_ACC=CAM_ASM_000278 /TAXON_ID=36767 /ORGANISM="Euplotes focardii, Strain TN1" /LENGTH=61 /DNA_ID=CAMNT_0053076395 /DNA_START=348 /DNA_END=533 /DNA_ORIENTATION=+